MSDEFARARLFFPSLLRLEPDAAPSHATYSEFVLNDVTGLFSVIFITRSRGFASIPGHEISSFDVRSAMDTVNILLSGNKYFSFRIPMAISRFPPELFFKLYPLKVLGTPSKRACTVFAWMCSRFSLSHREAPLRRGATSRSCENYYTAFQISVLQIN